MNFKIFNFLIDVEFTSLIRVILETARLLFSVPKFNYISFIVFSLRLIYFLYIISNTFFSFLNLMFNNKEGLNFKIFDFLVDVEFTFLIRVILETALLLFSASNFSFTFLFFIHKFVSHLFSIHYI